MIMVLDPQVDTLIFGRGPVVVTPSLAESLPPDSHPLTTWFSSRTTVGTNGRSAPQFPPSTRVSRRRPGRPRLEIDILQCSRSTSWQI